MESNNNMINSNSEINLKKLIKAKEDNEHEPLVKKICYNDKICNSINLDSINNNNVYSSGNETIQIEPDIKNLAAPNRKSPKKRLNLPSASSSYALSPTKSKLEICQYGNYSRYYSYRNLKDDCFHDIRLDTINTKSPRLFESKYCLDIGCNNGMITIEIAKKFNVENIIGLDIDKTLINRVRKSIEKERKFFIGHDRSKFPFNINFLHGNYILKDPILLKMETERFDVIICLSVTKWIHLNFGDEGLKQGFKRMFLQLKSGGKLILEAQPWDNYKRRKRLTPEINANYKNIKLFPEDFTQYLLSNEIGFSSVIDLGVPNHSIKGFQRPIQIFNKL